jgi:hypothetical protein
MNNVTGCSAMVLEMKPLTASCWVAVSVMGIPARDGQ